MQDSDHVIAQSHIELEKRIRERAHQIWLSHREGKDRGQHGALEDWLEAERQVLGENPKFSAQNRGTTVGDAHAPDRSRMTETSVTEAVEASPQTAGNKPKRNAGQPARKTRGATAGSRPDPDPNA